MNDLTGVIQLLFDLGFGPIQSRLAEIDGVRQERASRVNAARVAAVLKIHPVIDAVIVATRIIAAIPLEFPITDESRLFVGGRSCGVREPRKDYCDR